MQQPVDVLAHLQRSDPGRPRITYYDDTDGPTRGERVELSARVLGNWVNKAANLLQDEYDLQPGQCVRLDLPPHWRSLYWAFAIWSVGACVELGGPDGPSRAHDPVLVVTTDPAADHAGTPTVFVTLAALARSAPGPVPGNALDEARELATHPDAFAPWAEPHADDPALCGGGSGAGDDDETPNVTAYREVVPAPLEPHGARVHTSTTDLGAFLELALATYTADGSLVLSRGTADAETVRARLAAEQVTLSR